MTDLINALAQTPAAISVALNLFAAAISVLVLLVVSMGRMSARMIWTQLRDEHDETTRLLTATQESVRALETSNIRHSSALETLASTMTHTFMPRGEIDERHERLRVEAEAKAERLRVEFERQQLRLEHTMQQLNDTLREIRADLARKADRETFRA